MLVFSIPDEMENIFTTMSLIRDCSICLNQLAVFLIYLPEVIPNYPDPKNKLIVSVPIAKQNNKIFSPEQGDLRCCI